MGARGLRWPPPSVSRVTVYFQAAAESFLSCTKRDDRGRGKAAPPLRDHGYSLSELTSQSLQQLLAQNKGSKKLITIILCIMMYIVYT